MTSNPSWRQGAAGCGPVAETGGKRATLEDHVVRPSQQSIQSALRQNWIGKQRIPILGRAITGDDDRAGARAFTDQLVQVIRLLGRVLAQ